jgi:hypothetical protein
MARCPGGSYDCKAATGGAIAGLCNLSHVICKVAMKGCFVYLIIKLLAFPLT